jgi:hypothetical protein
VPVTTVPWPLMAKQWSIDSTKGSPGCCFNRCVKGV